MHGREMNSGRQNNHVLFFQCQQKKMKSNRVESRHLLAFDCLCFLLVSDLIWPNQNQRRRLVLLLPSGLKRLFMRLVSTTLQPRICFVRDSWKLSNPGYRHRSTSCRNLFQEYTTRMLFACADCFCHKRQVIC